MELLNTVETLERIKQIICNARKELVIASPFIGFSKEDDTQLREFLRKVISDGRVAVRVFTHQSGDGANHWGRFYGDCGESEVHICKALHAKIYYNEDEVIISSLNLRGSSFGNVEMSVYLCRREEPRVFDDGLYDKLFGEATERSEKTMSGRELHTIATAMDGSGHCIRCHTTTRFDKILLNGSLSIQFYCDGCRTDWKKTRENYDFIEKFCYGCGKPAATSREHPVCEECQGKLIAAYPDMPFKF